MANSKPMGWQCVRSWSLELGALSFGWRWGIRLGWRAAGWCRGRRFRHGRVKAMFQQSGNVVLDLLELVELQIGVYDGEEVARGRLFVDENPLADAPELFFDFKQTLAFEHDGEDVAGRDVLRIVEFNEPAQERLGVFPFNRIGRRRRRFIHAVPIGNKALAFARALAVLLLPARFANVGGRQIVCRKLRTRGRGIECSTRSC